MARADPERSGIVREIKAFIRPESIDPIVHALEDAGLHALTVIPVQAIGDLIDPSKSRFSPSFFERYSSVFKLEMVCRDTDVEHALNLIVRLGKTGLPGDGIVYVSPVEEVVRIRTGDRGREVLDHLPG